MIPLKLKKILRELNVSELQEVREYAVSLMKEKAKEDNHREGGDRFRTKMSGSCIIERESEFFNEEHKIVIIDASATGIKFHTTANMIKGDMLNVLFRSPLNNQAKEIYVKVVRIKPVDMGGKARIEVGAKSVDYQEVINYRRALSKGRASRI